MFFSVWIVLIAVSLWVSLIAFIWALQSGQFADQNRARYLPLMDEAEKPAIDDPAKLTVEVYVLLGLATAGLLGIFTSIFFSLYRLKG